MLSSPDLVVLLAVKDSPSLMEVGSFISWPLDCLS